jgi:mannose-6-phosphate isomerase-like protein (cupin superfamily)
LRIPLGPTTVKGALQPRAKPCRFQVEVKSSIFAAIEFLGPTGRLRREHAGPGEHDLLAKTPTETEQYMRRLNFMEDEPWDEAEDDKRVRWFRHPFGTDQLGASLIEYLPQAPGGPMHMHYGVEEMFFVLSGTLTVRTPKGEGSYHPATSSTSQKAGTGCTPSRTPRMSL